MKHGTISLLEANADVHGRTGIASCCLEAQFWESPGRWDGVQEETGSAKDSRHSFFGARILFFPHLLGKPLQAGLGDYFVPSLKNRYPRRAGFPPE